MLKPPFKTKGIYVRRIDPEKDIKNYKSTKLNKMWQIASGRKNEHFYEIIWFAENYSLEAESSDKKKYCADFSIMNGELLDLVDWQKDRGFSYADFENVQYDEKHFRFENETIAFSGSENRNFLFVIIESKETGESFRKQLRYIPWI